MSQSKVIFRFESTALANKLSQQTDLAIWTIEVASLIKTETFSAANIYGGYKH